MRASDIASIGLVTFSLGCTVHHHYPAPATRSEPAPGDEVSECAPLLPAPEALLNDAGGAESEHSHSHATKKPEPLVDEVEATPRIISHGDLQNFDNAGTVLVGLATASLGATNFEVWGSSVPPGGSTPLHVHETEEVFVVLTGKGTLYVGGKEFLFEAPATVIAPANVPHQLKNTGDVPTDQIVIVGVGSEIKTGEGKVMDLPWRK